MTSSGRITALSRSLERRGLDLTTPFVVQRYNEAVDAIYRLPTFDRPATLGLLVACSKAMWPAFLARRTPGPDPVDRWAVEQVTAVARELDVASETRFAHEPPPRRVAMQRLAELSGLAWCSPAWLSVHPTYGPWIALRAAIVLDCGPGDVLIGPPAQDPCGECSARCVPALERARGRQSSVASHWQDWVAVRDACPVGRDHRYDEQQVRYHYTKDLRLL